LDLEFAMSFLSFNFADAACSSPATVTWVIRSLRRVKKFLRPLLFNFNRRFGIVSVAGGFGEIFLSDCSKYWLSRAVLAG